MKRQRVVLVSLVLLLIFVGAMPATARDSGGPVLRLERDVSAFDVVAGESVHVTLTVHNEAPNMVEYTLLEDVAAGARLQSTGKGSYNRAAGFIVWRGQLHPGAQATHTYTFAADATAPAFIPLFASVSTLAGGGAEHASGVTRHDVVASWEVKEPHIAGSAPVPVTMHVTNPLPRPLTVTLETAVAAGLAVDKLWPEQITLAPLAAWHHETTVVPATDGTYTMTVQPVVAGYPAGSVRSAAVSKFPTVIENKSAASTRDDLLFLHPAAGHVYGEHEHMALSLEAPAEAAVTVYVNGQPVPEDRLAYAALDPDRGRYAVDYVAVPLQQGANEVTAQAVLPDGSRLHEFIIVHRAGAVSRITVEPVGAFVTGQWRPLVVRLGAYDDNDLPVADGTVLTVRLTGGTIVSADAQPGWQGHQVVVRDGYALVEIAPPQRATAMTLHAAAGNAAVQKPLAVVAHADDWFVLGLGNVRVAGDGGGALAVTPTLRFVARGPLGRGAVMTAAMDSGGFDAHAGARDVWTGATGETGSVGGDTGSLFVRWERQLSYVQLAYDSVPFAGELLQYDSKHEGMQAVWRGPEWEVRSFVGRTPVELLAETFAGDGTGFFPLAAAGIVPFSEDLVVQYRAPVAPYEIVHQRRLPRAAYYIDYALGHVILAQPLPRTDEVGNTVHLHATYRVSGHSAYRTVGGVQGVYSRAGGEWRATALQTMAREGYVRQHVGLSGRLAGDGVAVRAEAAVSQSEGGTGFGVHVHGDMEDVFGWQATADGRFLSERYEPLTATDVPGTFARLSLEREVGPGAAVFAKTAYARPAADAARLDTSLGTRWLWRNVRPQLAFVLAKEGSGPAQPAAEAEVVADYANGGFVWQHRLPLAGSGSTATTLQGRHLLTPELTVHVTMDTEQADTGTGPIRRLSWGLSQSMTGAVARTHVRGGVETVVTGDTVQTATVVGAETSVALSPHHTVLATWDQRRPWATGLPGFGGALGWTYEYGVGESALRYDHRVDGGAMKQAFAWRGVHAFGEALLLQGEAMVTTSAGENTTVQLKMNGVYRRDDLLALLSVTGRRQPLTVPGTTWEYRLQTAYEPVPNWLINAGGARRQTAAGTVTDKAAVGTVIRLADRYAVQAQLSHLQQHDTATGLTGAMVGVSRELWPHVWLTAGYGSKQYVGLPAGGDVFAQTGGGPFVELTFAFDETSVLALFSRDAR